MNVRFLQVDVFADSPFEGNPLAVFPEAASLTDPQMQSIASEMNLSETTFVTRADNDSYSVRIFTPSEEMPFAGHPTIGTAWVLRHLGVTTADSVVQHSPVGETPLGWAGGMFWFERTANPPPKLLPDPVKVAALLDLRVWHLGFDPALLRGSGPDGEGRKKVAMLTPDFSDAGVPQLMVPIKDADVLSAVRPQHALGRISHHGVYCFAPSPEMGTIRARGFFPDLGISEDPATGSAAAALGLYLAERIGPIDVTVLQGIEIDRPSRLHLQAQPETVRIGGDCKLILEGTLAVLPS